MKQKFKELQLSKERRGQLAQINAIIADYQKDGYRLTLRQLYYQLVVRNIITNKEQSYKSLGTLLKEGRMAGIVDWDAIVDRLRRPSKPPSWTSPEDIMDSVIGQYRKDRMNGQSIYIEVWVEKDALSEVLERVTEEYGINICVNRGYSSASAMYEAHKRFKRHRIVRILYIGDHDPSGLDMIRDIDDRINEFLAIYKDRPSFEIIPIALTREQIEEHEPPPNPAKTTDARYTSYEEMHGTSSWEVDSLDARVLDGILRDAIENLIDSSLVDDVKLDEVSDKEELRDARQWMIDQR